MNTAIQPKLNETKAVCQCGVEYTILSVAETMRLDICAACHPFYTGQQRFVDTEGRIERFKNKFGTAAAALKTRKKLDKKQEAPTGPPVAVSAKSE